MTSKRDLVLAALHHEEGAVPSWTMGFFNIPTAQRLLGAENVVLDYYPEAEYKFGAAAIENRNRNLKYAAAIDSCAVGVGKGANFSFGHGGPGEFMDRIAERGSDYFISRFETGVKKKVNFNPHFYHHFDYPLANLADLARARADLPLPDPNETARYEGIAAEAAFYKENGYFTFANINGIFSGIHYFFYPYDKLFIDMMLEKENLKILIRKLARFNLSAAENLLKQGVDCITFCDDLGDGRSLLFSPELYRELFWPYHAELADLCHSYGAFVHMHSHGNILKVFPLLVSAGIDMINPCDPYEGMDLQMLKEQFGSQITLVGGMNKFFFDWGPEAMRDFLKTTIRTGRKNGGFILMDSGGIPENITRERYDFYRDISREFRA